MELLCSELVLGGQGTSNICSSSQLPHPAYIQEILKGIGSGHWVQMDLGSSPVSAIAWTWEHRQSHKYLSLSFIMATS